MSQATTRLLHKLRAVFMKLLHKEFVLATGMDKRAWIRYSYACLHRRLPNVTKIGSAVICVLLSVDNRDGKRIKGLVSKETVVLRRWGSSTRKFRFYQRS